MDPARNGHNDHFRRLESDQDGQLTGVLRLPALPPFYIVMLVDMLACYGVLTQVVKSWCTLQLGK